MQLRGMIFMQKPIEWGEAVNCPLACFRDPLDGILIKGVEGRYGVMIQSAGKTDDSPEQPKRANLRRFTQLVGYSVPHRRQVSTSPLPSLHSLTFPLRRCSPLWGISTSRWLSAVPYIELAQTFTSTIVWPAQSWLIVYHPHIILPSLLWFSSKLLK